MHARTHTHTHIYKETKEAGRRANSADDENGSGIRDGWVPSRPSTAARSPRAMFTLHLRIYSCIHGTALRGKTHLFEHPGTSNSVHSSGPFYAAGQVYTGRRYSIILPPLKGLCPFYRPKTPSMGIPFFGRDHPILKYATDTVPPTINPRKCLVMVLIYR